jgi:hypothetical protein
MRVVGRVADANFQIAGMRGYPGCLQALHFNIPGGMRTKRFEFLGTWTTFPPTLGAVTLIRIRWVSQVDQRVGLQAEIVERAVQDIAFCGSGLWIGNDHWRQRLSAFPCRLKCLLLIPGTVKNVEDICAAAGLAVIDEVLPCGEAPHAGSYVTYGLTRTRVLTEQPETFSDSVNNPVRNLQTGPIGPIHEDFVQIPFRIL